MSGGRQRNSGLVLLHAGDHQARSCRSSWLGKVIYSAISGAVATVAGAGVSLIIPATDRVVVWCVVTCATSVVAGLAWDSGPLTACWGACCRWLRELAAS
jgi:hypothetical protein